MPRAGGENYSGQQLVVTSCSPCKKQHQATVGGILEKEVLFVLSMRPYWIFCPLYPACHLD